MLEERLRSTCQQPGTPDMRGPLRLLWWLVRSQPRRVLSGASWGTLWMVFLMPLGRGGRKVVEPDTPIGARALWATLEPLHAVVYFGEEHADAMRALGLKGWWMGYFASRAAPLGPVPPAVVEAIFYNFKPSMVRRALPDAWHFTSPTAVLHARQNAVERTLSRVCVGKQKELAELAELLVPLAEAAPCPGRPLAAANQALETPSTTAGRLWWSTTVLREHRGDGHVAALLTAEVGPLEAHVLAAECGRSSKQMLLANRGWTEADWLASRRILESRGLLGDDGLTVAGRALITEVESRTDAVAEVAWPADNELRHTIHRLAHELSSLIAGSVVPLDNPIGNPWPGTGSS